MTALAELTLTLESVLWTSACFSAVVGLYLRLFRPQSRFDAASGGHDRATLWLGVALGLVVLVLLLPLLYA